MSFGLGFVLVVRVVGLVGIVALTLDSGLFGLRLLDWFWVVVVVCLHCALWLLWFVFCGFVGLGS